MRTFHQMLMWPMSALTLIAFLGAFQGWLSPAWLIPMIIILPVLYVFQHPLNIWYVKQFVHEFPTGIEKALFAMMPYYRNLNVENRRKFRKRTLHLMTAREHIEKAMDSFPLDAKAILAAAQVQITFGFENYQTPTYERIALYPSDFPSPEFKKMHASETHDDGILIFALDRLMFAFMHPKEGYNIAIHETTEACLRDNVFAIPEEFESWVTLDEMLLIRGIESKEAWLEYTGLEELPLFHFTLESFFTQPLVLQNSKPELYRNLCDLMQQDPLRL